MPFTKYNVSWPTGTTHLEVEMGCIHKGGTWKNTAGKDAGQGLEHHYHEMRKILWPHLDDHRWYRLSLKEVLRNKVTVLMGPKSCVAGHTRILNPITGESPTIKELHDGNIQPIVQTVHGPRKAGVPFVKGVAELFEVVMESGNRFTATHAHRVMTESGYRAVESLQIGQCLLAYDEFHQESISEFDQPEYASSDQHLNQTAPNFQSDCPAFYRSCDEPFRKGSESSQCVSPSPVGVQKHIRYSSSRTDVSLPKPKRTRLCQSFDHPSTRGAFPEIRHAEKDASRHSFSKTSLRASGSFSPLRRFPSTCTPPNSFGEPIPDSFRNSTLCEKPWKYHRGPLDAVQSIKSVGVQKFYDLCVPDFHHYFAEGVIHHNSGKTHICWLPLCDYFCFPEKTLILVSSTTKDTLRMRVWGEISDLWQQAKDRFPHLDGHLIDSRTAITTDSLDKVDDDTEERRVRDMRKGIVGIATIQNGTYVGLSKWIGIKQKNVWLLADEAQMMGGSFLSAFANLDGNERFRAIVCGNPNDQMDPLGKAGEPEVGWKQFLNPPVTAVWKTRFMGGTCINFVGTDSPNNDFPEMIDPPRYPYLISAHKIENTAKFFGKDTYEYLSQCVGTMRISGVAKRVLTMDLCRQFRASDDVVWSGKPTTKIYALDAAYGGDRCIGGAAEFGEDVGGNQILAFEEPHEIPIIVDGGEPEDQIAKRVRAECEARDIPPDCMGHDATGRGSLGTALARIWSAQTNPIEFGGRPTDRPVSLDMFVEDSITKQRRLKRCDEHYDRFVTELWFSVRYAVEAGQIRRLPEEPKEELCLRAWEDKNGKKSVEPKTGTPTKPGMKQRTGKSPDMGDWAATIVEMARRKGFNIAKLAITTPEKEDDYLEQESNKYRKALTSRLLQR